MRRTYVHDALQLDAKRRNGLVDLSDVDLDTDEVWRFVSEVRCFLNTQNEWFVIKGVEKPEEKVHHTCNDPGKCIPIQHPNISTTWVGKSTVCTQRFADFEKEFFTLFDLPDHEREPAIQKDGSKSPPIDSSTREENIALLQSSGVAIHDFRDQSEIKSKIEQAAAIISQSNLADSVKTYARGVVEYDAQFRAFVLRQKGTEWQDIVNKQFEPKQGKKSVLSLITNDFFLKKSCQYGVGLCPWTIEACQYSQKFV